MATLGQERVRAEFNPSEKTDVVVVKEQAAALIDFMERNIPTESDGEVHRLKALGHTAVEEAAMWYVKALTS